MKSIIKVLVCPSDRSGVGAWRSIWPAQQLKRNHSDEIEVHLDFSPDVNNIDYLSKFDIIHFHRLLGPYEGSEKLFKELQRRGVKMVMDIDDYWLPPPTHHLHALVLAEKMHEKIENNLRLADWVTTTTEIFAEEIRKFNQNVFVIPNAINKKESMWASESVENQSGKVRVGWAGGSCYDDKTEVLTDNGFKLFVDLDPADKIACLNPETDHIEYHLPNNYINEPYVGDLICAETDLVNFAVTPNHNMYASEVDSLTHKKLNMQLMTAESLFGKNIHVKKNANWQGDTVEFMELPAIDQTGNKKVYKKYTHPVLIPMDLWLKFFGFWMAEGWTSKTVGLKQVGIAQIKENGILEEMYIALSEMGFNPTYTKDGKQLRVFDKRLWSYLSQFGYSYEKFIPKIVKSLPPKQLEIFLKYFLLGDGSCEQGGRWRGYTSSKQLADDINEICLKMNVLSSVKNRGMRSSKKNIIRGRQIIAKHDGYAISIGSNGIRSKATPLVRAEKMFKSHYDGIVYCVNVPHNIIYVRRNGKGMWCGNSHLHDLKKLEDSMALLAGDQNLEGKFQMVVSGFDIRGSMTEIRGNERVVRPIQKHETIWLDFERIFTNNYALIKDEEYKKWLLKIENKDYPGMQDQSYIRRWTLPLSQYAKHYDHYDICMAPLAETYEHRGPNNPKNGNPGPLSYKENMFNKVKSELKILESGMKKKVLIAQDFGIYSELIEDGVTGILINKDDDKKGWYKAIKRLINDPDLRNTLANNLHEFVKDRYDINVVNESRLQFYKQLVEQPTSVEA